MRTLLDLLVPLFNKARDAVLFLVSFVLLLCALLLASMPAFAQTSCAPTPSGTIQLNCTNRPCAVDMCWSVAPQSLSGCKLFITGPGGTMPAISGTVINPTLCRVTLPLLTSTGVYSFKGAGVNAFGEGGQSVSPLSLETGLPPGAPNGLAAQ